MWSVWSISENLRRGLCHGGVTALMGRVCLLHSLEGGSKEAENCCEGAITILAGERKGRRYRGARMFDKSAPQQAPCTVKPGLNSLRSDREPLCRFRYGHTFHGPQHKDGAIILRQGIDSIFEQSSKLATRGQSLGLGLLPSTSFPIPN